MEKRFGDIQVGTMFIGDGEAYIKIRDILEQEYYTVNAINLITGETSVFSVHEMIKEINNPFKQTI